MRIRIDKIYGHYYHSGFDKYVMIARIYVNGQFRMQNLFFCSEERMMQVEEGSVIDY